MIDERLNMFQFESRIPHELASQSAWCLCKLEVLTRARRSKVASILEHEVPALNGRTKWRDEELLGLGDRWVGHLRSGRPDARRIDRSLVIKGWKANIGHHKRGWWGLVFI
ncbi:hypothetical protein BDW59DRAFT_140815, partial [Aspergillus cavernicola]